MLIALTAVISHTYIARYAKAGPEIVTWDWNADAPLEAQAKVNKKELYLSSSSKARSISIYQNIKSFEKCTLYKFSAEMKYENVQQGIQPWNGARLIMTQYINEKPRWNLMHTLALFVDTGDWESHCKYFFVEPDTEKIQIRAQLSNCTGSFWVKNIHLNSVIQTKTYTCLKIGITSLWSLYFGLLLGSWMIVSGQGILKAFVILSFAAIIFGTIIAGDMKTQVSDVFSGQIMAPETSEIKKKQINIDVDIDIFNLGHFFLFLLFSGILTLLLANQPMKIVLINMLLLAGSTEIAQLYIDGRSPLFSDFLIDIAGGLTGVGLVKLYEMKKSKLLLEKTAGEMKGL
ncbi:MAG: VanZ family protein [Desulfobacteraceae bacterium]|nr:VanZ family protein [Desulfobacteraceae bacterium]